MRINQMFDNGQPQTQTRGTPGRTSLGLAERLEHLRNEFPRNAFAAVSNGTGGERVPSRVTAKPISAAGH